MILDRLDGALRRVLAILPLAAALVMGGCATLPASGPTGPEVRKTADVSVDGIPIRIVEVSDVAELPSPEMTSDPSLTDQAPPATDKIGVGDILDVFVYEAGVALFGSSGRQLGNTASLASPTVSTEALPPIRVSDAGTIQLPYAGTLTVDGLSITQVQALIRRSLRGLSENPQVLVAVRSAVSNTLIVGGEVQRPGRLPISTGGDTLSDLLALAGGVRGNTRDLAVRVIRGGSTSTFRLSDLLDGTVSDVRALPGDRLTVLSQPRSFSVLGAAGRVDVLPFVRSQVPLVEALAQAGGVNPAVGDPAAVFVFRYVFDEDDTLRPVVYHIDMTQTGAFFLAQRFLMRDADVLYVANARANQPSKLVQLVSQLFSPLLTITAAAQVLGN